MYDNDAFNMAADDPVNAVISGTAIRPQRNRPRPQEPWEENPRPAKKQERKKSISPRRAPSRGRYIDEYARPVP